MRNLRNAQRGGRICWPPQPSSPRSNWPRGSTRSAASSSA